MTEIHDQSYRRYRGTRESRGAWTVIAIAGIKSLIRKRVFLGLLLAAWIPFIIRAVQFYVTTTMPQAAALIGVTPQTFRDFLDQQNTFVFFVTIYVGAGLIAQDRRSNALQIYLSKPLTRSEYIAGKLSILIVFLLLVTLLPALLLLLLQGMFAGSFLFLRQNLHLVPAIVLFALLQTLLASCTMLALSSLTRSSRYAGVMYAGAVLFTDAMYGAMRVITGRTLVSWVSFPANLAQLGDLIFRLPLRYETPWIVSLIAVAGLIAVSLSVLERRVRGVEVVS